MNTPEAARGGQTNKISEKATPLTEPKKVRTTAVEASAKDLAGRAAVMAIDRPWLRSAFGPEALLLYLSTMPDDAEEVSQAFLKVVRTWNSKQSLGLSWPPSK